MIGAGLVLLGLAVLLELLRGAPQGPRQAADLIPAGLAALGAVLVLAGAAGLALD